jgi:hypothetical protein
MYLVRDKRSFYQGDKIIEKFKSHPNVKRNYIVNLKQLRIQMRQSILL